MSASTGWKGRISPLAPDTPAECVTLYRLLRGEMSRHSTDQTVITSLALAGVQHLARDLTSESALLRILLIGDAGVGKTTLARALARAMALPSVYISAADLAQTNWYGSNVADFLSAMYDDLGSAFAAEAVPALASRAIVVIDDLCALRAVGSYGTAENREYQVGRQTSLLSVIGDGEVQVTTARGKMVWRSRQSLVICCGIFPGLERSPTAGGDQLSAWGLIPALADRLGAGAIVMVQGLSYHGVICALRDCIRGLSQTYQLFGFRLHVSDEAIGYVAEFVGSGAYETGIRGGVGWLTAAAENGLLRMLESHAPQGEMHVLSPDDLNLPSKARGLWREI